MDALQCKYLSKPCLNERSLKDDGTRHRLCALHRARARDAQRRWHARRRNGVGRPSKPTDRDDDDKDVESTLTAQDRAFVDSEKTGMVVDTHERMVSPVSATLVWPCTLYEAPLAVAEQSIHAAVSSQPKFAQPHGPAIPELDDWCTVDALQFILLDGTLDVVV